VKSKDIHEALHHKLSDKEINHMIREKERFMENPRNYAMYKNRLAKERDIAAAEGNTAEADRLTARLAELEERAENLDKARSEKISSIALINDRNRKRNIEKAEENIKMEIEKKKIEGESCDPFTRSCVCCVVSTVWTSVPDPVLPPLPPGSGMNFFPDPGCVAVSFLLFETIRSMKKGSFFLCIPLFM
jgi:hypothetical protein